MDHDDRPAGGALPALPAGLNLLAGKTILVTGVLTDTSLAYSVARLARELGATVLLTSFGRALRITERIARRLGDQVPVLELDVTDTGHLERLAGLVAEHTDRLDGAVHAIGFAPESCLGGDFLAAPWSDVAVAVQVSTYSYASLIRALLPVFPETGGSYVGLDFDATRAWPSYDWMGIAKAGLESANRYLARDLGRRGLRVNLVAAGPVRTIAAKSVPGFSAIEDSWDARAPLGWDVRQAEPVARAVTALLSDLFPATTGEIVHVDGGVHAMG